MTAEQKFYQWFRKQLPITADCCRVETSTMGGMPDVNVCWQKTEVWVELKIYVGGRVLIRPEQNAWIHRRSAAGGRCYVIAKHPSGEHIWSPRLGNFTTYPHGKYLAMQGAPCFFNEVNHLITFLFT